jgi:hypothetical protein
MYHKPLFYCKLKTKNVKDNNIIFLCARREGLSVDIGPLILVFGTRWKYIVIWIKLIRKLLLRSQGCEYLADRHQRFRVIFCPYFTTLKMEAANFS